MIVEKRIYIYSIISNQYITLLIKIAWLKTSALKMKVVVVSFKSL